MAWQKPLYPPRCWWLDLEGAAALKEGSFENLPLARLGEDVFEQPVCYLLNILNGRLTKNQELTDLCSMPLHGASVPFEGGEALDGDVELPGDMRQYDRRDLDAIGRKSPFILEPLEQESEADSDGIRFVGERQIALFGESPQCWSSSSVCQTRFMVDLQRNRNGRPHNVQPPAPSFGFYLMTICLLSVAAGDSDARTTPSTKTERFCPSQNRVAQ